MTHTAKLQAQVTRLREDLNVHRTHRQELSQEILADAKERLEQLQYHVRYYILVLPGLDSPWF